jgi:hypothetical protein
MRKLSWVWWCMPVFLTEFKACLALSQRTNKQTKNNRIEKKAEEVGCKNIQQINEEAS